jgi:hypothetical protein
MENKITNQSTLKTTKQFRLATVHQKKIKNQEKTVKIRSKENYTKDTSRLRK